MEPSAKVIADSITLPPHYAREYPEAWQGRRYRLTTLEVVMHRFVLAEFNTHRMFSRNSASSRAIPAHKMMQRVRDTPAMPALWPREQSGMQGGDELPVRDRHRARSAWLAASEAALAHAMELQAIGVHKSVTNRLLEPFMWHVVIVSATEWENFFRQRCSPLAQPEIRLAAEQMQKAMMESTPKPLELGEWHMPYMNQWDLEQCTAAGVDPRHVSSMRCARVSYLTHDGQRDVKIDSDKYNDLVTAEPPHASPLEHVATPCAEYEMSGGNFRGYRQFRHVALGM